MTRENKLALVIGFALILFVGVLVSDHFSAAANERAADFTAAQPALVTAKINTQQRLIDLSVPETRQPQVANDAVAPADAGLQQQTPGQLVHGGGEASGLDSFFPVDGPAERPVDVVTLGELPTRLAGDANVTFHDVRSGETFYSICREHYGNANLLKALARYNSINDPASLTVGRRLRIPSAAALAGGGSAPQMQGSILPSLGSTSVDPSTMTPSIAPDHGQARGTYVVRSGDTLSRIAKKVLGSSSRYQEIIDLNADTLSDPDDLRVGSTLKVPVTTARAR